jgi:hypothetical protein
LSLSQKSWKCKKARESPQRHRGLHAQVLTQDELGARIAQAPTLFYLPHCEGALCCNLLKANAATLHNVAILGNSFMAYHERWSLMHAAAKEEK